MHVRVVPEASGIGHVDPIDEGSADIDRRLTDVLREVVGRDFNLNSPIQLRQILYEERGLSPTKKTKTGLSTDAATLEATRLIDGYLFGEYLVAHWDALALVRGESLVYWLKKLVFRSAWLDHRVKEGLLEVSWDDDQAEFGYCTRFGDPMVTHDGKDAAGLHVKMPWPVDSVTRVDRRLQVFDLPPTEALTRDRQGRTVDKTIAVDAFVCWRVPDTAAADRFIRTVGTVCCRSVVCGNRRPS